MVDGSEEGKLRLPGSLPRAAFIAEPVSPPEGGAWLRCKESVHTDAAPATGRVCKACLWEPPQP